MANELALTIAMMALATGMVNTQEILNGSCPVGETTWNIAASKFNCSRGSKYSCLYNENGRLIQGCFLPYRIPPGTGIIFIFLSSIQDFKMMTQRHILKTWLFSLGGNFAKMLVRHFAFG